MYHIPPVRLCQDKKHPVTPAASHSNKQHVAMDNTFTKRKQYSTVSLDPCTVEYLKSLERDFLAETGPHFSSQRSFRTVSQPPIYQRQNIDPSVSSVNLSGATSLLPRPPGSQSLCQGSKRSLSDSLDAAPQLAQGSTVCDTHRHHRLLNNDHVTQVTHFTVKVERPPAFPSGRKVKRNSELNLLPG
jgi:hypothetical protein